MIIFLAGATGFVGERVLNDLLLAGHEVTALAHSDRSVQQIATRNPGVKTATGDVASAVDMLRAVPNDTQAVIYLPGLLRESSRGDRTGTGRSATFRGVHVDGVRNVLAAARKAGVSRWIQMSALGAKPQASDASNAPGMYYRTKWEAEELVRGSGLDWTILRPSLIFDDRPRHQHNFMDEIAKAIRIAPFVPILGYGQFLFQPVSVDDISETILQSLANPKTIGKTYEIGGPDKITYRELVLTIAHAMGTKKPPVRIPFWFLRPVARLVGRFSWFPVTYEELEMLHAGNFVRDAKEQKHLVETFQLPMKRFSDSVPLALRP